MQGSRFCRIVVKYGAYGVVVALESVAFPGPVQIRLGTQNTKTPLGFLCFVPSDFAIARRPSLSGDVEAAFISV